MTPVTCTIKSFTDITELCHSKLDRLLLSITAAGVKHPYLIQNFPE
jgi:hypothetical protein